MVLLDSSFGARTPAERRAAYASLAALAVQAGITGTVAAVWRDAAGRTRFLAPPEQHAFFQIVSYMQWEAQVNRTLECD